jgi:hypothetical protein
MASKTETAQVKERDDYSGARISQLALESPKGYGLVLQTAQMTRLVFHSVVETPKGHG